MAVVQKSSGWRLLAVLWLSFHSLTFSTPQNSHLRGRRRLESRSFSLFSSSQVHATLLQWQSQYPNLVRVTTAQESYGLPTAGDESDCPYDAGVGCLNYILIIQDYIVHPEKSASANALPQVLWNGELHGDERVGPTVVMEAALLLLQAASCEATFEYNPSQHETCSQALYKDYGITKQQRQWLARLVATRQIIIVPTANALGYYQNIRTEGSIDVNRDFPFDYTDPTKCMQSIAARTLNEVFRENLIQMALSFHGGTEMIGYEWGADSYQGVLSPDDTAQSQLARAYSQYGGGWNGSSPYQIGPMDQIIYTVQGGMEDWAYAGSWIPEKVVQCQPTTFGGYDASKTMYNNSTLRAFNVLVETSKDKTPSTDILGTLQDVLTVNSTGNGHVARNIRVALAATDLVEPYVSFVRVENVSLETDMLPLTERNCPRVQAVQVPQTLSEVTVEWTVGGALEIDDTSLWYGNWSSVVSQVDCLIQPSNTILSNLTRATMQSSSNGTGYFSTTGASPTTSLTNDELSLGPIFRATVDLSSFSGGDQVIVMARARVDSSWRQQPQTVAPLVPPQSHMVQARTNPSWFHRNHGNVIRGRRHWYSVLPLTLVISDSMTLQDFASVYKATTPNPSRVPTQMTSTPPPTVLASVEPSFSPTKLLPPTQVSSAPAPVQSSSVNTLVVAEEMYADARCAAHPVCVFYGLADNCCPTAQGIYLDCCGYGYSD